MLSAAGVAGGSRRWRSSGRTGGRRSTRPGGGTGAGWRFSLLSVLAVLLLGLPVSVLISPFIAAVGLIGVDVANEWTPHPTR